MKSKPVEYHPSARLDFVEAFEWYELHEEDLGARFRKELGAAEDFIRRRPLSGQPHKFGTRRWPLKVFPYPDLFQRTGVDFGAGRRALFACAWLLVSPGKALIPMTKASF